MIRQNILANIIGRAWGFISVYLFVPLYLHFLGIEAYGLVGFYSTLLGVLAFADMGFTATLNREMARLCVKQNSAGEMRDLLRTYETAYLCISLVLASAIWVLSPLIAERWLHSTVLSPQEMAAAIRLMGVAIAFQLPSGLYIGGLMGLQKQVAANSIQIAWGVFRGLGAVLVLWLISPTISGFAFWQLISNAVYCFLARRSLWRALSMNGEFPPQFKWQVFRNTWRYAAGMGALAVISILLTQTDKLAVSKFMSLEMLGYYSIAVSLASVPLLLASPIASAVFPRLTELVASEDRNGLKSLYHRSCKLVAVSVIPAGVTIALFADDVIRAWTGSGITAERAGLVASLLIGGQLMQAFTVIPYYLALAHGDLKLNIMIGIISIVLVTPLLIVLILKYGVVGAGFSWLIMNLCTFLPYMWLLHRRFLPGELQAWILRDVGKPLLAAAPAILLSRWLFSLQSLSRVSTLCLIVLLYSVSAACAGFSSNELRSEFMRRTSKLIGTSHLL